MKKLLYITLGLIVFNIFSCSYYTNRYLTYTSANRKINRHVLKNKLIFITEDYAQANNICLQLWVKIGDCNRSEELGVAHLLEHLLFDDIKKEWIEEFGEEPGSFNSKIDAFTSRDFTYYEISTPRRYLIKSLDILSKSFTNLSITENNVILEKKHVIKELEIRNSDPFALLWKNFAEVFFDRQPYYAKDIIGNNRDDVLNISLENLRQYYKDYYTSNNVILTVIGDNLTEYRIIEQIQQKFGGIASGNINDRGIQKFQIQTGRKEKTTSSSFENIYFAIGWDITGIDNNDVYALEVVIPFITKNGVQGGYLYHRQGGTIAFYSETGDNYSSGERLEKNILDNLKNLLEKDISQQELQKAKDVLLDNYNDNHKTASGRAYALSLAECIGDITYDIEYISRIKRVMTNDLKRGIAKYLKDDNYTVVILKPIEK
ncbi:MAG: pitrilysin family protein [bacterium]